MDAREQKLRGLAEAHGLELAGVTTILWPRGRRRQLEVLREAWAVVEPDCRAGRATGELAFCNYGRFGVGWRPKAFWLWSRPDLAELANASDEDRLEGLRAAGELLEREQVTA